MMQRSNLHIMVFLLLGFIALSGVFAIVVDLEPKVSPDFFFGTDDPGLQESKRIHEIFPSEEFVVISAASDNIFTDRYFRKIEDLSESLKNLPGVSRIVSVADGPADMSDASDSPFWQSLLINEDEKASLVLAFLDAPAGVDPVSGIKKLVAPYENGSPSFNLRLSGIPYIVDRIRENLIRDFILFSGSALLIFAGLLFVIFRSKIITIGATLSGLAAVMVTMIIQQIMGQMVGILTANLAIIVFVLTQSQIIYLTSNWRRRVRGGEPQARQKAVKETFVGSSWCIATTLLGFLSLLFVAAEPLRQLGLGGVIGSLAALSATYAIYPFFLSFMKDNPVARKGADAPAETEEGGPLPNPTAHPVMLRAGISVAVFAIVVALAPNLMRLNTDPSLLAYFEEGSDLRSGLAFIDHSGGSSPLEFVVRIGADTRLDSKAGYEGMWDLHKALLAHPDVGAVISLPTLMAEANRHPLAFLLRWSDIVDVLSNPLNARIADSFLTQDRTQTLFVLRMHEEGRLKPRNQVIAELTKISQAQGFEPVLIGGIYQLQGRLADLVATSLTTGLLALLVLFAVIAWLLTRTLAVTIGMTVSVALIPAVILGGAGLFQVPIDVISAPASNVCIGLAVDAMIHLSLAVKRLSIRHDAKTAWTLALKDQSFGIVVSAVVVGAGFAIFALSGFPPTARFGGSIVVGCLMAAVIALSFFPLVTRLLQSILPPAGSDRGQAK